MERQIEDPLMEAGEADRDTGAKKPILVLLADVRDPARPEEELRQREEEPRDAPDESARTQ
jgi:hypothetical protein